MTMVGQYEIRELLGAGGIGQVHAAFDTDLQREVALKSLRSELLSDTSFIEQFRGEAKNLARLSHPNITTIYTVLSEGGNFYLVMECVRGETLEDLLKKRGGRIQRQREFWQSSRKSPMGSLMPIRRPSSTATSSLRM